MRTVLGAAVLGALAIGAVSWVASRPKPPPQLADEYRTVLPWANLHEVNGVWVGTPTPDWAGLTDPAHAVRACEEMLDTVDVSADGSITIQHPETGAIVVECGL